MRYAAAMIARVSALCLLVTSRVCSLALGLCVMVLVGCGHSVQIQGTADEVWSDTLEVLRLQGVMPKSIPAGRERPRVDRAAGEIDLLYTQSVYYGDGAAFIQVDVDLPEQNLLRDVQAWVDFPVGNRVVRYGRALDSKTTEQFARDFDRALATFRATHPARKPPEPAASEVSQTPAKGTTAP